MRKKKSPVPVAAGLLAAAVLVGIGGFALNRYAPTGEHMDKMEYYGLTDESQAALVVDDQVLESRGIVENGSIYVNYRTAWDYFNSGFYWDAAQGQLMLTLPAGTSTWRADDGTGAVILGEDGTPYISAECIRENSDIDMEIYQDPQRIVARTRWEGLTPMTVTRDAQVRYRGGPKSEILTQVSEGDTVVFLEDLDGWIRVSTADGYVGYMQSEDLTEGSGEAFSHTTEERFLFQGAASGVEGKINMGFHYIGSQDHNETLSQVIASAQGMNVIAPTWFSLQDSQGTLLSYGDRAYVDQAHSAGLRVWAVIGDVNGTDVSTGEVLADTAKRTYIVQQLMQIAAETGLDGINVDFESIREETAPQYLQFLKELCAAAHAQGLVVSADNFVPLYTKYYKRREQAKTVDYIVIMGYDEHTASSEEIGSVASLPFVEQGITDTLEEVPKEKVINAIPFYTRAWTEVFGEAVPQSEALGMDEAAAFAAEHGIVTSWDGAVGQNVGSAESGEARYSIWLEDERSIEEKMKLIQKYDLAGAAQWRLGFERASVWPIIDQYLQ